MLVYFQDMMLWSQDMDFKFLMQIKLLIKKSKIWFCLQNIPECWDNLQLAKTKLEEDSLLQENNHDKKQIIILRQKIYYHKGIVFHNLGEYQNSIKYLNLCLQDGSVFYNKLRIKCLKKMGNILISYKGYEENGQYLIKHASFFRKDKRDFYFLIDKTHKLNQNVQTVIKVINNVYAEQMKDSDTISLVTYDEKTYFHKLFEHKVIPNNEHDTKQADQIEELYENLKQPKKNKSRNIFYSCIQALNKLNEADKQNRAKYLFIFAFGENNFSNSTSEQSFTNIKSNPSIQSDAEHKESLASEQKENDNSHIKEQIKPPMKNNLMDPKSNENNQESSSVNQSNRLPSINQNQNTSIQQESSIDQHNDLLEEQEKKQKQQKLQVQKKKQKNQKSKNEENNEENKDLYYGQLIYQLQSSYVHVVLIGENLKKHGLKKNKYLRLCTAARRYSFIDLQQKSNPVDVIKEINGFLS